MKAELLHDGTIGVSGRSRIEKFDRIVAGIGWPDVDPGYICVIGERTDGRYHALWEKRGGLWEIGDSAREAKDRFLIDCVLADTRDELAASYLRTLDGLCFPKEDGKERPTGGAGSHTAGDFRDRETVAALIPVPERVTSNYRSALEKTRGVIMAGRLMVHEPNCPVLVYTLRQPLDELLRSPVMKALVWAVSVLEDTGGSENMGGESRDPWYLNLSRELG